jgi:flagellar export protein FliJ
MGEQQRIAQTIQEIAKERGETKNFVYSLTDLGSLELRNMSSYLLGLDARTTLFKKRLEEAAAAVADQRKHVTRAQRNVRLLTKLRERKMDDWKREADQEIETNAQEAWLSSWHRKHDAGSA